jgi:hypothetical protein
MFDPKTPRGFYFNRGIHYFGKKVEGDMAAAEQRSRKGRKPGVAADRLANAARLGVLSKAIGVDIKRHRDPGAVGGRQDVGMDGKRESSEKDTSVIVKRGF